MGTKGVLKKPSAATADDSDDGGAGGNKMQLALQLAGGDQQLAEKALSLKQSERNQFADTLRSGGNSLKDLKDTWGQLQDLGNGRNKKL